MLPLDQKAAFNIQMQLISNNDENGDLNSMFGLLNTAQVNEVIEERYLDSRCGNPTCVKSVVKKKGNLGPKEAISLKYMFCCDKCFLVTSQARDGGVHKKSSSNVQDVVEKPRGKISEEKKEMITQKVNEIITAKPESILRKKKSDTNNNNNNSKNPPQQEEKKSSSITIPTNNVKERNRKTKIKPMRVSNKGESITPPVLIDEGELRKQKNKQVDQEEEEEEVEEEEEEDNEDEDALVDDMQALYVSKEVKLIRTTPYELVFFWLMESVTDESHALFLSNFSSSSSEHDNSEEQGEMDLNELDNKKLVVANLSKHINACVVKGKRKTNQQEEELLKLHSFISKFAFSLDVFLPIPDAFAEVHWKMVSLTFLSALLELNLIQKELFTLPLVIWNVEEMKQLKEVMFLTHLGGG